MKKVLNYAKCFLAHPAKSEINLLIFNIVAAIFPAIFMVDWYLLGLVIAADIVVCMAHGAWSYGREISFGIKEASLARQVPPWQTPVNSSYRIFALGSICILCTIQEVFHLVNPDAANIIRTYAWYGAVIVAVLSLIHI